MESSAIYMANVSNIKLIQTPFPKEHSILKHV